MNEAHFTMGDTSAAPTRDYRERIARLREASTAHSAEMCERERRRARKLALWMVGLFVLAAAFITGAVLVAPEMPESVVLLNLGLMSLAASIMAWMLYTVARRQARNYANDRPLTGMFAMVANRILREAKAAEQRHAEESRPAAADAP